MCRFCEQAKAQLSGEPFTPSSLPSSSSTSSSSSPSSSSYSSSAPYATYSYAGPTMAERLEIESCALLQNKRLPVTLLCGYLGSGKTTLLNHILRSAHGQRLAVIENEFGSVSIDDALLPSLPPSSTSSTLRMEARREAEVVLLPNGCLCCRARQDLVTAFLNLLAANTHQQKGLPTLALDGLILELSGLADVGPVVQTFFSHPEVQAQLRLDAIICVVDALALSQALALQGGKEGGREGGVEVASLELIAEQLALADRVLLNKMDLLGGGGREGHVHKKMGFTSIGIEITDGPLEWAAFEQWLGTLLTKTTQTVVAAPGGKAAPSLPPSASPSINGVAASTPATALAPAEDPASLPPSTQQQQQQQQQVIVRMKGIVYVTKKTPYRRATIVQKRVVLQGIYGHLEMNEEDLPPSLPSSPSLPPSLPPCSKLVLIGRFVDAEALKKEMERGLLECLAPGWYSKR